LLALKLYSSNLHIHKFFFGSWTDFLLL